VTHSMASADLKAGSMANNGTHHTEHCLPSLAPLVAHSEGVGVVEATRGTLIHHYKTDDRGIVHKMNLIVPRRKTMGRYA
jgi:coenzyme F420-reducing hydrogenase alpha subunit